MANKPFVSSFVPTEQQRRLVELMVASKTPRNDMRHMIIDATTGQPIDYFTMIRTFESEMAVGSTKANLKVAQNLLRIACSEDNSPATVNAAVKWLKMFAGMKEAYDIKYTDSSGVPIVEGAADTLRGKISRLTGTDNNSTVVPFKHG